MVLTEDEAFVVAALLLGLTVLVEVVEVLVDVVELFTEEEAEDALDETSFAP